MSDTETYAPVDISDLVVSATEDDSTEVEDETTIQFSTAEPDSESLFAGEDLGLSSTSSDGSTSSLQKPSSNIGMILGIVFGILFFLMVAAFTYLKYFKKNN